MSGEEDASGLRVAIVSARALPLMGGVETHVHEVAKRLSAAGADVSVLTTDTTAELPDKETSSGYTVRRWPAYPSSRDYYFSPGLLRHLKQSRHDYDLVHVQGVHTLIAPTALTAARRAGLPSLLTFHTGGHSSGVRESLRGVQWKLISRQLRGASGLIAVCEYERRKFSEVVGIPEADIRVIRNGCDPLPVDTTAEVAEGDPLVVSVGRLERYKGHHRVLRAMPHLLSRRPGARLVLVGGGPYEESLRAMASELGVSDRVMIRSFGPDERGQLGKLMSDADVMCLLSEYEAHPIAVMEAVGAGTKALVADTSGLTELVHAGLVSSIGINTPPEGVAETIEAISDFAPVVKPDIPSWDDCANSLLRVYREVVAR